MDYSKPLPNQRHERFVLGNGTGVYTYQGAVANKALELLGRNIGEWTCPALVERRLLRIGHVDLEGEG